jgi:hypothetical protein
VYISFQGIIRQLADDPFWGDLQLAFRPLASLAKFLNRKIWKQASNLSTWIIHRSLAVHDPF